MNLLLIIFAFFYMIMAQRIFNVWLKFFQRDASLSFAEKQLSWAVLIIGTILWPIVVPTAYIALLEKKLNSGKGSLDENNALEECYSSKARDGNNKSLALNNFSH
jgi:hypothetical protein